MAGAVCAPERPMVSSALRAHDDRIDAVDEQLRRLDDELARIRSLLAAAQRDVTGHRQGAAGEVARPPAAPVAPGVTTTPFSERPAPSDVPDGSKNDRGGVRSLRSEVGSALLTGALVALGLIFALSSLPTLVGYMPLVVRGGSMGDAAPTGSLVLAKPIDPHEIDPGDVIVVGNPNRESQFLHRVTRVAEKDGRLLVLTKGDANKRADPNWYEVSGPVPSPVHVLPYLGFAVALISTPLGWILLVLLPAGLTCAACVRWIWRDRPRPTARPAEPPELGPVPDHAQPRLA
jgi:signal peptidase